MSATRTSSLFSGTPDYPIYVDHLSPALADSVPRVVMIHGACNTGTCFLVTPDGRPGWAHDFVECGIEIFVVDWPGHGRSPKRRNFTSMSSRDVRDSIAELLKQIGPAVLVAHSAGGQVAWSLAEQFPALVLAVVGIAPAPPANLVPSLPGSSISVNEFARGSESGRPIYAPENEPFWVDEAFVQENWFSGPQAPPNAASSFFRSVVPESPQLINERFNVGVRGLAVKDPLIVGQRPILIITGDNDPRHPLSIDQRTSELFNADFAWLPDLGIVGNGHMLMSDSNSGVIANYVIHWIKEVLVRKSARKAHLTVPP